MDKIWDRDPHLQKYPHTMNTINIVFEYYHIFRPEP